MKKHILLILVVLAASVLTPAMAGVQVDRTVPASASGAVNIENPFGSVTVIGWDQNQVKVSGTIAAGVDRLEIDASDEDDSVEVSVDVPDSWFFDDENSGEFASDLTVHVPRESRVEIEIVNGPVTVSDLRGEVSIEAVNGSVTVSGNPREVEIEAMTGDIDVDAEGAEVSIEAVSGNVKVRGAGTIEIEAVAGDVTVEGTKMKDVAIESVNGDVELRGGVANRGGIGIETLAGNVRLLLDPSAKVRFDLSTFSGKIVNPNGPSPRKNDSYEPGSSLSFATGDTDFEVSVETFSGTITVGAD